jgi:hypothetical protein
MTNNSSAKIVTVMASGTMGSEPAENAELLAGHITLYVFAGFVTMVSASMVDTNGRR